MVVGDFAQGTQVAVIGGGTGGYVAAIRAAQLGLEVILVEKELLGGVCLNWGCIPSKAFIYVADLKNRIEHADKIGLIVADVKVDLPKLVKWKDDVVEKLRKGVASLLSEHKVQVVTGTGYLTSDHSFTVDGPEGVHRFEFQDAILATGSSAAPLPGIPHDGKLVIDSTDALNPKTIPERMVVVGAGSVGLELGIFYAKMGTDVTMLEAADKLLPMLDSDIGKVMERALKRFNIKLVLGAKALSLNGNESRAELKYSTRDGEKTISTNCVLVGIGRRPNTTDIGLEKAGVKLDSRGMVEVNSKMQTSVPHIFAIGDMVAGQMLAHKAMYQGKVAAEVIAGQPAAFEGVEVPGVIFSDPEIATVGLGEDEARAKNIDVKVGIFPFKALGRTRTIADPGLGFTKLVSDATTGAVLGVHIVGPNASDLISEGSLAVASASHIDDLALTIHPHPTLPESIEEAAEEVEHRAIDIFTPPQGKKS